ncbi:MAG: hypothetical protein PHS17_16925 [Desulfobacterales bacterium]|nr:hypothetical protein [Desulfobacterales bacterium]
MEATLNSGLILSSVPNPLAAQIQGRLIKPNPAYRNAIRMRRWVGNIPKVIRFYQEQDGCMILPRGFLGELVRLCAANGIPLETEDRRRTLPPIGFAFKGTLRHYQEQAVKTILTHDQGILQAPRKRARVIDYVDSRVPVLRASARARQRVYGGAVKA